MKTRALRPLSNTPLPGLWGWLSIASKFKRQAFHFRKPRDHTQFAMQELLLQDDFESAEKVEPWLSPKWNTIFLEQLPKASLQHPGISRQVREQTSTERSEGRAGHQVAVGSLERNPRFLPSPGNHEEWKRSIDTEGRSRSHLSTDFRKSHTDIGLKSVGPCS